MTAQEARFILIIVINLIATVIYLDIDLFLEKDNRIGCWVRAIVMLLCPITGALMLSISHICFRLFLHKKVELEDAISGMNWVKRCMPADKERECRLDLINDFQTNVQKIYRQMKENEEDRPECAHILIDYMNPVLKQQVFTGMEQKSLVDIFDDVCEMLYEADPEGMDVSEFKAVSLRLLEVSEFACSQMWCDRAALWYPDALSTYTCRMKLYFVMREKESFFRVLNELKQSGISIDRETLEVLRVFM